MIKITKTRPRSSYCHYSNPNSQGSLIAQTKNWPEEYDPEKFVRRGNYSDRLTRADLDRVSPIAGGEGGWTSSLPKLSDKQLKEFASLLLDVKAVRHVRAIYYYNHSTGFPCPYVECLVRKPR